MLFNLCVKNSAKTPLNLSRLRTLTKCISPSDALLLNAASVPGRNIYKKHLITVTSRKKFIARHSKDNVAKDFDLVFENSLNKILGPCRIATTGVGVLTILSSLGCLVYDWSSISLFDAVALSTAVIFTIPTVILVNALSRRYFLRIYFNEIKNSFIGINQNFMGSVKKIEYSPRDINVVSSLQKNLRYDKTNIKIYGRPFHLKANDFILPKYYNMHTGQIK